MSNYKQINLLNLKELEQEIDTMIEIIGDRMPSDDQARYVGQLIKAAKALGSKREW